MGAVTKTFALSSCLNFCLRGILLIKFVGEFLIYLHTKFHIPTSSSPGTAMAQWLRCYATNRKVAGSIPAGVIVIFHLHNPSDRTMTPGVDSASNRNEYQEHFLGVKTAGA